MSLRVRFGLLLGLVSLLLLFTGGAARAAITVSNTSDSGPGSLRQSVEEAPPGETIILPAGTYSLTSGSLQTTKSLTIEGHGSGDTTIRSGGAFRVMLALGKINLSLSGVTIRDGFLTGLSPTGAGLLASVDTLNLRDVVVTHNTANGNGTAGNPGELVQGAGMAALGTVNMTNSRVTENVATAVGGSGEKGGVAIGGGALIVGAANISGSTVSGNLADGRGGQGPADPEQTGGGAQGAGLVIVEGEGAPVAISASTFSGNVGDVTPGPGGSLGSAAGGGLLIIADEPGPSISETTIAGNTIRALSGGSTAVGAGLATVGSPTNAPAHLVALTVSGNTIQSAPGPGVGGGNVFAVGGVTFADTIVANGSGPPAKENCFFPEPPQSLGFNLDSTDQCGFHGNGDKVNADPRLGPLADNGGPTHTMLPAASSPAVDQGAAFGLSADQRGVQRPIDFPSIPNSAAGGADGSDIGAVELQPSNAFKLGKLKKNKKKGTATLTVILPLPSAGTLVLSGKGLKTKTAAVTGQEDVKLKVAGKGKVRKALRKRGKRKVKIKVTYTPTGNAAATLSRTAKLVRKRKKKHRRHAKR